jgi:hypothetical protein
MPTASATWDAASVGFFSRGQTSGKVWSAPVTGSAIRTGKQQFRERGNIPAVGGSYLVLLH